MGPVSPTLAALTTSLCRWSLPSTHQLTTHTFTALSLSTAVSMLRTCQFPLTPPLFPSTLVLTRPSIAHLVGFALKLRNLGVSDHGLIRELSTPLAGSLYSGEGHSRLYDDPQVYDLAVTHALETTDVEGSVPPCEVHHRPGGGLSNPNPYHLPWIMRGLLEEDFVKTELSAETAELVRQFDDWKPVTKALKDVKYRLEAVRSKL